MKIADLYAQLGLRVDETTLKKAEKALEESLFRSKMKVGEFTSSMHVAQFPSVGKMLGGAGKKIALGVAGVLKAGVVGGVAAGGALAGLTLKDSLDFERELVRLKISSRGAIGPLNDFRNAIFESSKTTGLAKEEILKGAAAFVALTGDGAGAAKAMDLFARVAQASGASIEDVSVSAAALFQNMKIAPAQFEKAFSILIAGGKAGAIELKDVAGLMASLAAANQRFADSSGTGGMAELAAGLQIARQGFGSAAETATGLEALMGSLIQNFKVLKKQGGVEVFGKDGKLRNFRDIVEDISKSKLMTKKGGIEDALGRKEAIAAFYALVKNKGAWEDLTRSVMNANDVQEDFAENAASDPAKVSNAWNRVKIALAEAFTPDRLNSFADKIQQILGFVVEAIDRIERFVGKGDKGTFSGDKVTGALVKGGALKPGQRLTAPLNRGGAKGKGEFSTLERTGLGVGTLGISELVNLATGVFSDDFLLGDSLHAKALNAGYKPQAASNNVFNFNIKSTDPTVAAEEIRAYMDRLVRAAANSSGASEVP